MVKKEWWSCTFILGKEGAGQRYEQHVVNLVLLFRTGGQGGEELCKGHGTAPIAGNQNTVLAITSNPGDLDWKPAMQGCPVLLRSHKLSYLARG